MAFHVVLPRPADLAGVAAEAAAGERPRHAVAMIAAALDATIDVPDEAAGSRLDRLRARLTGFPGQWAMAARLRRETGADDVLFCTGEDVGYPVAARCAGRRGGPKVALFVHNVDRPRARAAFRLWRLGRRVDLWMSPSQAQLDHLAAAGVPPARLLHVFDQTDLAFFTPGPASAAKVRPLIVSVGLEQRDYRTLAAATHDLPVDVRISGFSTDLQSLADAFPVAMPANMRRDYYGWRDLAQLYRDADAVVVSVNPNRYAAGAQASCEALAAGRPVVMTGSAGMAEYLDAPGIEAVPPGDAAAMRAAILAVLDDPAAAAARGAAGRAAAERRYATERYVDAVARALRALATR